VRPEVKRIRVLLVDDHTLIRAGISALLERIEHVEIVGEAVDGHHAQELIDEFSPDVVLLDLQMSGLSGYELLQELSQRFPQIKIVVLSVHDTAEYALRAIRGGASGYIPKSAASGELELAIDQVTRGEQYLSPTIASDASLTSTSKVPAGGVVQVDLTPRQREVLVLIAKGFSTKDAARSLGISVKTVETHRAQLMGRLGIYDVAGLVRYAIRTGTINLDD
jgi:DNA-binding NarL/FixJ family response regulator